MKKIRGFLWDPMEKRGARCRRALQLRRSLNNILSAGTVRYVSDREADELFDLVYIVLSLSRKFIKFTDAGDVAFPSRQFLQDRLCLFQSGCGREASGDLAIDLVAHAYWDLIQIAQRIQYCESNFCRALSHAAVFRGDSIEPAYSSRSSCRSAVFTDTPQDGVTRFSYGTQDARAREYIIKRAENCGCSVSIDALQNIRIGLPTNKPGRKTVLSGSHIDTVRNGGWLDGIYGVCGALEVLETLAENPDSLKDTSFNYELVIFAEEEGSGFGSTMTGSKFITGIYAEADLDKLVSDTGMSLRQTLQSLSPYGPDGKTIVYNTGGLSQEALQNVRWDFDQVQTMLELHIEQGPVLDREGLSLGIVDSIFGMRVIEVTLTGVGNHAGATPMTERYDALCTAAECILAAEAHVKTDDDKRTVVTCGKMDIEPNCSNVIPETVRFSLEVRDKDETKIDRFMNEIIDQTVGQMERT